jgi:peptidyl-prolyl cis-trans isomerase D
MLTFMRKHAKSWFIKVLLGTVIVVFIFFYGFNLRQRSASTIASVNGTKIGIRDFQKQYQRLLEAQQQVRSDLTPAELRSLKEVALDHLIDQILLFEQAERWEVSVQESEVRDYIQQIPVFQQNGEFSLSRYRQFLRLQGQSEDDFVKEVKDFLLIQKVEQMIRDTAKVTDEEVADLYRLFNEQIVLNYVALTPAQFRDRIDLSAAEIKAYFEQHLADYRLPERVRVQYLQFDYQDYLAQVEVSNKEIQERYQATQDRWKVSKQVLARHILLRTTEDEDPKARMAVFQKAESLLQRLREGEDFAKLAKEYSQDPGTASEGGSLGWLKPGELPPSLEKALFEDMTPGQLSDRPIKTPEGFHILKLEKVRSETIRPLEEVQETLKAELKEEKARQLASEFADQAFMAVFQGATFKEVSEQFKASLKETQLFPLEGPVEGIDAGQSFREAAFGLKGEGDFSDVVQDNGRFYILGLLERQPSRDPRFEEVEDRVGQDLRDRKALELAQKKAEEAVQELQDHKTLSQVADQRGWEVETSSPLGRMFRFGELPGDLVEKAFSLDGDSKVIPESFTDGNTVYLAEVKERIPPDTKKFEEQRDMFRSMLLREEKQATYQQWMEMLRSRSQVKRYKAFQDLL